MSLSVNTRKKKILKCQCLGNVVTAKCKIQRDKRAPLSIVTVRIVKIETEGIINGNIFTEYSEHFLYTEVPAPT